MSTTPFSTTDSTDSDDNDTTETTSGTLIHTSTPLTMSPQQTMEHTSTAHLSTQHTTHYTAEHTSTPHYISQHTTTHSHTTK